MVGGWGREGGTPPNNFVIVVVEEVKGRECGLLRFDGGDGVGGVEGGCGCVVGQQHNQIQHDHNSSLYYLLQKCREKPMYLCSVMLQKKTNKKLKKKNLICSCVLWLLHDMCSFVTFVKRMHRCVLGSCRQIEKNQKAIFLFVLVVCRNSKKM